jgi:hypothetical protein
MRIITIIIYLLISLITVFVIFNLFDINTAEWLEPESIETDNIEKQLYNSNWDHYRLGDVYYQPYINAYNHVSYHIKQFPESIAAKYLINCNGRSNDILLLSSIVSSYGSTGNNIDLIIHIRIGDIMCDIRYKDNRTCYSAIGNYQWWELLIEYINNYNINNIVIISGSHTFDCLGISARYLLNRKKYIENNTNNTTVQLSLGKSPDEDLIFANKAKYFISTGGGYGKILGELVKYNGGIVLYTTSCNNPKLFINVTIISILITITILILLIK